MAALQRWNDDRLDDLKMDVDRDHANISALRRRVDKLTDDQDEMAKRGDRRRERSWDVRLLLGGCVLTGLINLGVVLAHAGH